MVSSISRTPTPRPVVIVADDDVDDLSLITDAWNEVRTSIEIKRALNGRELLDMLERLITNGDPLPAVVLLDLNMPFLDGWEVLSQMKQHSELRSIPVVVFTTSSVPEHVQKAYDMQAAGFVTKPTTYRALIEAIDDIDRYWLTTVSRHHG